MAEVFSHWVGELKGDANTPLQDTVKEIDMWFPEKCPNGSTQIGENEFEEEVEVFRGVYKSKFNLGPIHITMGINVKFKGVIEYWMAP